MADDRHKSVFYEVANRPRAVPRRRDVVWRVPWDPANFNWKGYEEDLRATGNPRYWSTICTAEPTNPACNPELGEDFDKRASFLEFMQRLHPELLEATMRKLREHYDERNGTLRISPYEAFLSAVKEYSQNRYFPLTQLINKYGPELIDKALLNYRVTGGPGKFGQEEVLKGVMRRWMGELAGSDRYPTVLPSTEGLPGVLGKYFSRPEAFHPTAMGGAFMRALNSGSPEAGTRWFDYVGTEPDEASGEVDNVGKAVLRKYAYESLRR